MILHRLYPLYLLRCASASPLDEKAEHWEGVSAVLMCTSMQEGLQVEMVTITPPHIWGGTVGILAME